MGLLLIIGIAALGYFADQGRQDNDSSNHSIAKDQNLTNNTASNNTTPSSKSQENPSQNKTEQNKTHGNYPNLNNMTTSSIEISYNTFFLDES